MERKDKPNPEDVFVEAPLAALLSLGFCLFVAIVFLRQHIASVLAFILGVPLGFAAWFLLILGWFEED
jgi:hypothetical protein